MWIPKYRRKALYAARRKYLGPVFRDLAQQREGTVEEGHLQVDHVHLLIAIPPKYAVAQVLGYVKGKSAIHIARTDLGLPAELHGPELFGPRILRLHGGPQ